MSSVGPFAWSSTKARAWPCAPGHRHDRRSAKRFRRCQRNLAGGPNRRHCRWCARDNQRLAGIPPRKYLDLLLWLDEQSGDGAAKVGKITRAVRWLVAAGYIQVSDEWCQLSWKTHDACAAYRAARRAAQEDAAKSGAAAPAPTSQWTTRSVYDAMKAAPR